MENNNDILQRMERRLIELEEHDRKRRTRNIIVWIVVIAALAVLLIVLMPKIEGFVEGYNNSLIIIDKVVDSLDGVDTGKLSETLKAISEIDTAKIRSIAETINDVSEILDPIKDFFKK